MSRATLYSGDVRDVLARLPEASVQCVVTSPPYWGLRDYGVPGQLGLEPTPEGYVVLWLNLGDSYAGGGQNSGSTPDSLTEKQRSNGGCRYDRRVVPRGLKPKDLVGIPWRVAFALQADGWWLRSDIVWAKPNPMPESVTDRPTRSHEYLFLLTKSERYFFDAQAIAEDSIHAGRTVEYDGTQKNCNAGDFQNDRRTLIGATGVRSITVGNTRNARSVWTIATQPYPEAHFATFPEELARRCILAGSSPRACEHCGAPWERVTNRDGVGPTFSPLAIAESDALPEGPGTHRNMGARYQKWLDENPKQTTSWQPTCDCENSGSGRSVVLDPFGGSGTVAQVATGNGRDSIYIDLNPKYLVLARQRIGPMLCEVG